MSTPGARRVVGVRRATTRLAARAVRKIAGRNSRLERAVRERRVNRVRVVRSADHLEHRGRDFVVRTSRRDPSPRTGIYLFGGCDLPSLFRLPELANPARGALAIQKRGSGLAGARSALLLDQLDRVPEASAAGEILQRLRLPPDYFEPVLFEPNFEIPGLRLGPFPKTVVVLSVAADVIRPLYRHREHGLLVDPGGWWLNRSVDAALDDPDTLTWFRESFEPLGRLPVDEFADQFHRLVRVVQERTGAQVLVFDTLTVEPRDQTHNFQLRRRPEGLRRRNFHLALADLSRDLGFHIVDVDRVLKREGVEDQLESGHFPESQYGALAAEAHRILTGLGVLRS